MICKFIDCIIDNSIQTYGRPQGGGKSRRLPLPGKKIVHSMGSLFTTFFSLWGPFYYFFSLWGALFSMCGAFLLFFSLCGGLFWSLWGAFFGITPLLRKFLRAPMSKQYTTKWENMDTFLAFSCYSCTLISFMK